ncbi:CG4174, partial [Drosophila busckii]
YAKLAPFKMEQLSLEPYIAPYHGFATRREMDLLKALAKAELTPAKIYDGKKLYIDKERTATLSWLTHKHDLVLQLFKRLELITGICQYGGPLQVSNYGIGGYFHEHLDFFDELNDVDQGGATVFPKLNLTVQPESGAALVFHNLLNYMQGDPRTLHLSCPVLNGNKWIANKWTS